MACNDFGLPKMNSSAGQVESPVRPGETFAGKYVVERVIGTGGMGVVLAAHHPQLGQTVAIKLLISPLADKPEIAARFLREARAAARLHNQHVARVMDAGTDEAGRQYIVMEYLIGNDLRAVFRRQGFGPLKDTVGYILHACEALAEAHAAGIVHRDLKPENLFLTKGTDGSPLIKVLDFGISKNVQALPPGDPGSHVITTGQDILGSPAYMSPEQLRAPESVDARTDVWALGVILYEFVTGRRPFAPAGLADLIAEVLSLTPQPPRLLNGEVPEELSNIVMRCLAKKAENRLQNVGELAQALKPWAPRWARESPMRAARTAGILPMTSARGELLESTDRGGLPMDFVPPGIPAPQREAFRWGVTAGVAAAMIAAVIFLAVVRRGPDAPRPAPARQEAQSVPAARGRAGLPPVAPPAAAPTTVDPAPAAANNAPSSVERGAAPAAQAEEPAGIDARVERQVARPLARRPGGGKVRDGGRVPRPTGRLGTTGIDPLEGRR
ncbi:MAG TPA: serine/threonine-protein kinase [Polyangia bacterium]|jgi:serine/threonine-protein kinase|nr:serine/threonine-protein kinase [Polyangia bacterium]